MTSHLSTHSHPAYECEDDTAVITGYTVGADPDPNLVIPSELDGRPVAGIDDRAFDGANWATSLIRAGGESADLPPRRSGDRHEL